MRRLSANEMLAVAGGDDGEGIGTGTDGGFDGGINGLDGVDGIGGFGGFGDLGSDGFNGGMDPSGADPSGALGFDAGTVDTGTIDGFNVSVDSVNSVVGVTTPDNVSMTFSTIDNALVSAINVTVNDVTVSYGVSVFSNTPGYTVSDPFGHISFPPGDASNPVPIEDHLVRQDPMTARYA